MFHVFETEGTSQSFTSVTAAVAEVHAYMADMIEAGLIYARVIVSDDQGNVLLEQSVEDYV